MLGLIIHVTNCEVSVVLRRDGFYLELLTGMPDIEDIVVAEEQRRESLRSPLQVGMSHAQCAGKEATTPVDRMSLFSALFPSDCTHVSRCLGVLSLLQSQATDQLVVWLEEMYVI